MAGYPMDTPDGEPLELELAREEGRRQAEIDLIVALLKSGLPPSTIHHHTGIPLTQITNILHVTLGSRFRTPEDDELAAEARKLAKRIMSWAHEMLDVAPLVVQVQIAKSVMGAVGRMVGSDQGQSFEEAHQAFQDLMASQRVDVDPQPPITSQLSEPKPFLIPTDDPD